jgi:hypothetical protein
VHFATCTDPDEMKAPFISSVLVWRKGYWILQNIPGPMKR